MKNRQKFKVPIMPPTHPYYIAIEAAGHKLIRKDDGEVDEFRLDIDFVEGFGGHNGPECSLCGETWCVWCQEKIEPCKKIESSYE